MPLFHPPFFDDPGAHRVQHDLVQEYTHWPMRRRRTEYRKAALRQLLLWATGQWRLQRRRVPASARRILWIYDWTTLGDSLMDLSPRSRIPPHITLDLLIAPQLADVYRHDPRFAAVHTTPGTCTAAYDALLLHSLSTRSLQAKRRAFRRLPFVCVMPTVPGEQLYNRIELANLRIETVFQLPAAGPVQPSLHLGHTPAPALDAGRTHVAVLLGARDARRSLGCWPQLLGTLQQRWPAQQPAPLFHLLGNGSARQDRDSLPAAWRQAHCMDWVDAPLLDTAALISQCQQFLGPDGGLMHVAIALGRPGLALFTGVDPRLRLLPGTAMATLFTPDGLHSLAVDTIAKRFLAGLDGLAGLAGLDGPAGLDGLGGLEGQPLRQAGQA